MVSGLDLNYNTSECLNANVTLSMGSKKISTLFGEGKLKSGEVKDVNIGVDSKEFDKFNTQKFSKLNLMISKVTFQTEAHWHINTIQESFYSGWVSRIYRGGFS